MTWLRDLLVGFFTRHLGAKVLALLLSVGLFGFVQGQLTGTQEVPRLELRFSLADELKGQYVLVVDKTTFLGLTMTGMRGKVDPLAKTSSLTLAIDQRVLNVYGRADPDGVAIPIDARLFRDEALFGKDVTLGGLPEGSRVVVNTFETRSVRLDVAPALRDMAHPDYEGRLAFTLNVKTVRVAGPKSAFSTSDPTAILVTVANILPRISAYPVQGDTGTVKLPGVDVLWADSGIKPTLLSLVRITAEELSSDPIQAKDFPQRLVASCQVTKKKEVLRLQAVPIEIRYAVPGKLDLLAEYNVFSVFTDADLSEGKMRELEVRLPAALAANEDFLANLVVVLDVSAAKKDLDRLKVPFYLDLKDRSRDEDLLALPQVDLVLAEALAEFGKRP